MKLLKYYSDEELEALKKGQEVMTDMLREFDSICRTNGLKYWCVGGTLIGTIRHKGWIPHDADVDVAMLRRDYEKLQSIIQNNLSEGFWFQDRTTDKYYTSKIGKIRYLYAQYDDYKSQVWHNGIQLDIFVLKDDGDVITASKHNGFYFGTEIAKDMIFPLKVLSFEDIQVYVPGNYEKYCEDAWGQSPPPELPDDKKYPHEGRIKFNVLEWMKEKYSFLYPE